jgi:hypothetical protein
MLIMYTNGMYNDIQYNNALYIVVYKFYMVRVQTICIQKIKNLIK